MEPLTVEHYLQTYGKDRRTFFEPPPNEQPAVVIRIGEHESPVRRARYDGVVGRIAALRLWGDGIGLEVIVDVTAAYDEGRAPYPWFTGYAREDGGPALRRPDWVEPCGRCDWERLVRAVYDRCRVATPIARRVTA